MNPRERELRLSAAAAGTALLAGLTWSVWSTTGSRLSLFLCVAVLTVALIDVVWAHAATRRLQLSVTANPAEAMVGDTVVVTLALDGPRHFVRVSLLSFTSTRDGVGVELPTTAPLTGVAPTREVLTEVAVEVVSPGLAGLVSFARRRTVRLARPLAVGPRPAPAAEPFPELFGVWGDGEARPAPTGDLVRGVRPYLRGDPLRRVHWRATARVGDLVVKEVEEVGAPRLVLALDMGGGGLAGERAAGRAAWYALEGLRRGYHVVLATRERPGLRGPNAMDSLRGPNAIAGLRGPNAMDSLSGPNAIAVTGLLASPSDVIRRLAAAAPGTPEVAPDTPAGGVLFVTHNGDSWR